MAISTGLSFRVSDKVVDWLESQALPGESLHSTAKRLMESMASSVYSPTDTVYTTGENVRNSVDTVHNSVDTLKDQLKQELRDELVGEINELINHRFEKLAQEAPRQVEEESLGESQA